MKSFKKNKVEISVLISVYYKEKAEYLDLALQSIFNQTVLPQQVVIVEDGPLSAELENVIQYYYENNKDVLEILKLENNLGLGAALNIGLKVCKHRYVARMDSDDYSLPNRLEEQMKFICEHPDYDVIGSNIIEYDELLENKIDVKEVPENDSDIKKYAITRNPVNHMSVIFKKEAVLEAGGYEDCPYFEDYYLWVRMIMMGYKFYNIQKNLIKFRSGLNMINRRGGVSYIKNILNFEKKIKEIEFISKTQYIKNIIVRSGVAIFPPFIRMNFYRKGLRRKL